MTIGHKKVTPLVIMGNIITGLSHITELNDVPAECFQEVVGKSQNFM